jgi:hypothetical protein
VSPRRWLYTPVAASSTLESLSSFTASVLPRLVTATPSCDGSMPTARKAAMLSAWCVIHGLGLVRYRTLCQSADPSATWLREWHVSMPTKPLGVSDEKAAHLPAVAHWAAASGSLHHVQCWWALTCCAGADEAAGWQVRCRRRLCCDCGNARARRKHIAWEHRAIGLHRRSFCSSSCSLWDCQSCMLE